MANPSQINDSYVDRYNKINTYLSEIIKDRGILTTLWETITKKILKKDLLDIDESLSKLFVLESIYLLQLKPIETIKKDFNEIKDSDKDKTNHATMINKIDELILEYDKYFSYYIDTTEKKLNFVIDVTNYKSNIDERLKKKMIYSETDDYRKEIDGFVILIILYNQLYSTKDNSWRETSFYQSVIKTINIKNILEYYDELLKNSTLLNYYSTYKTTIDPIIEKIKTDKPIIKTSDEKYNTFIEKYDAFHKFVNKISDYRRSITLKWKAIINLEYEFDKSELLNSDTFKTSLISFFDLDNEYHTELGDRDIKKEFNDFIKNKFDNMEKIDEITSKINILLKNEYKLLRDRIIESIEDIKLEKGVYRLGMIYAILKIFELSLKLVDDTTEYKNNFLEIIENIKIKYDEIKELYKGYIIPQLTMQQQGIEIGYYQTIINNLLKKLEEPKNPQQTTTQNPQITPQVPTQKTNPQITPQVPTQKTNPQKTNPQITPLVPQKTNPQITPQVIPKYTTLEEKYYYNNLMKINVINDFITNYHDIILTGILYRKDFITKITSLVNTHIPKSLTAYLLTTNEEYSRKRENIIENEIALFEAERQLSLYPVDIEKEKIWQKLFQQKFKRDPNGIDDYSYYKTKFDNTVSEIDVFVNNHGLDRKEYVKLATDTRNFIARDKDKSGYLELIINDIIHLLLIHQAYNRLLKELKFIEPFTDDSSVHRVKFMKSTINPFMEQFDIQIYFQKLDSIFSLIKNRKYHEIDSVYSKLDLFYKEYINITAKNPPKDIRIKIIGEEKVTTEESTKIPKKIPEPKASKPIKENPIEIYQEDESYLLNDGTDFNTVKKEYNRILETDDKTALENFKKTKEYKEYVDIISNNIKTKVLSLYTYKRVLNNPVYVGVYNSDYFYQPSKQKYRIQKIKDHHYLSVSLRNNVATEMKTNGNNITFEETNNNIQFPYNDKMRIFIMIIFENDYNPNTGRELEATNNGHRVYYRLVPLNIHKNTGNIIEYDIERINGNDFISLKNIIIEIDDYYRTTPNTLIKLDLPKKVPEEKPKVTETPKIPETTETTETTETGSESEPEVEKTPEKKEQETIQGKYNINELDIGYLNIQNDSDNEEKYKKNISDIGKKMLNTNTKESNAWKKWSSDTDEDSDSIGYFT
jgi:hypothetical protein